MWIISILGTKVILAKKNLQVLSRKRIWELFRALQLWQRYLLSMSSVSALKKSLTLSKKSTLVFVSEADLLVSVLGIKF